MSELKPCEHKRTGSCSPNGIYLYVRCMDCGELLSISDEGKRRLDSCPGYDSESTGYQNSCIHCGFAFRDHPRRPPSDLRERLEKHHEITEKYIGIARLMLKDNNPEEAMRALDDCCNELGSIEAINSILEGE